MRIVVLTTDPEDGNARAWHRQLIAAGAACELLHGAPPVLPAADLVIAHVLRTGRPPGEAWATAARYEDAGVRLLNGTGCLGTCADKRLTHRAWQAAGLPQPRTWLLEGLSPWPGGELLLKPAFGESARDITLVRDRAHALELAAGWMDQAVVQEVLRCRSVLRVHATPERVIGAFARPAAPVPGLPEPDPVERPVRVTPRLHALATAAVRAVGGGLVGLDLIERGPDDPVLLEANATFSVPVHLPGHLERVVGAVLAGVGDPPRPRAATC